MPQGKRGNAFYDSLGGGEGGGGGRRGRDLALFIKNDIRDIEATIITTRVT